MLTAEEFVNFTNLDLKCTNKSEFPLNILKYKNFVNQVNESIEIDKACLNKVRKGVKNIYNSGSGHSQNELIFCDLLEKIVQNEDGDFDADGDKISTGIFKFAVVMRDLSKKYKQLMQNLGSLVVYPLDLFLKGDIKNDAKRPFEKALKDYETKAEKLKREKLSALNKENASTIYKPNGDAPFDFSEDLERERRIVQIQLCEFLIKLNEIKSRKGAELVQQLIDYYRAQTNYLKDSLMMMEHMGLFMNDLVHQVDEIKNKHIEENQLLVNTRRDLKAIIEKNTKQVVPGTQIGYSLHQPQGNKAYGTSKDGWLLKKSDGKVKRVWQKRRVKLLGQSLMLYHGDDNKAPVTLHMLTCHIKHPLGGDSDNFCFDLISNNRTYNFRAEDDKSLEEWLSVLSNAKTAVFEEAMSLDPNDDDSVGKESSYSNDPASLISNTLYSSNNTMISSTISNKNKNDFSSSHNRKIVMKKIKKLDGNEKCADCGGIDPEWVSVNFGVLICLECCGVHRELGVHHSRTQSLRMDTFYSSQLLLPRFIGNKLFNNIYEASLSSGIKPPPSDTENRSDDASIMQQRRSFIRSKYIDRKYVSGVSGNNKSCLKQDLLLAIQNFSIKDLLHVYGEGIDLMIQFTSEDDPVWGSQLYSGIHLALVLSEKDQKQSNNKRVCMYDVNWDISPNAKSNTSLLTIIEFILQNTPSANLKRVTSKGDTILHQAIKSNQIDAIKVILKAGVICSELMSHKNKDGHTAIALAQSLNRQDILNLLNLTMSESAKDHIHDPFDDLEIDWAITSDTVSASAYKYASMNDCLNKGRNDSTSSTKSDSSYIDFNHSILISDESQSLNYKKDVKTGYKSLLSYNADEKIGIKASSNPWNEVSLQRKRSIKGPAPEPPVIRSSKPTNVEIIKTPRSKHVIKQRPEIAPRIRNKDNVSNKTDAVLNTKSRTKSSFATNTSHVNATLPRNMPFSYTKSTSLSNKFSPLKETDDGHKPVLIRNNTNLRNSSHISHSSDHIDVLLDVLEEPKKPSIAKEVIHISLPAKHDKVFNKSQADLGTGIRTAAKFNCTAENVDELSFRKGDIIIIKNNTSEDGWWDGYLEDDPTQSGLFPANFVQKLT